MNYSEKARMFRDLAQLIRSGVPFPKAINTLARHARGSQASVLHGISRRIEAGDRVAEAIEAQSGRLDTLEIGIIAAADSSGTLDKGLTLCAEYYESLAIARRDIRTRLAYPLFILHFAALTGALPLAFGEKGDVGVAIRAALFGIGFIWLLIGIIIAASKMLVAAARGSSFFDSILRNLPVIGTLRRAFAMSRFCAAYNMQLDAGINVYSSLDASARASGSAVVSDAAVKAARVVSDGASVADGIAPTGAFPEPVVRAFLIGEQTGRLDQELARLAAEYRESALRRLATITEWFPRIVYIGIALYIGWTIIRGYLGYFQMLNDVIKG
jgi:type II secretory pathway component PulF